MSYRHGTQMPPKDHSVLYHYHFHYIVDPKQGKEKLLRRVASDDTIQKIKVSHQDSDKQSTSSHQSWKRLINPAFQAQQRHQIRSFKSTSPTAKPRNPPFQEGSLKLEQLYLGEKRAYLTPKTATKRERASTITTFKNREQEMQEMQQSSLANLSDQPLAKINPQSLQKSIFSKKPPFYPLEGIKQKYSAFETQSTKISLKQRGLAAEQERWGERPNNYAYSLLDEQCKYLRRTFLKHYIKNHLLKQQAEEK